MKLTSTWPRPRGTALCASVSLVLAVGIAVIVVVPAPALAAPPAPTASPLSPPSLGAPPPGTPAPSSEDEAAGRRHYKRGDELFKLGRFLDAAREFEAGFQAAPRPLFLLNIGHSYRKAQELRKARTAYEEYLKMEPTSSFRPDVEDLIRNIDDALGASALPALPVPPAPSSTTTSSPLPAAAPPAAIDLAPPVVIEVEKAPPPSESRSIFRSPWFWGAVGVVVVAGVAGTVYGLNRTPACTATRCLRETD